MHTQMKTLEKKAQVLKMYLAFHEKRKKESQTQLDEDRNLHDRELDDKQSELD